ncbi:MAG: hypothetical protein ACHRHE_00150 [Tepidisphaerales bacterium]
MRTQVLILAGLLSALLPGESTLAAQVKVRYRVLSAETGASAPFSLVDLAYGPANEGDGISWQLTVRKEEEGKTSVLFELRGGTSRDPLGDSAEPLKFTRYQLRVTPAGEVLEYRNIHTRLPLLPRWQDFLLHFIPRPAKGARRQQGFPATCEYLGHVLSLERVDADAQWAQWENVKVLELDPELLVGTSGNSRDKEGHRLPQTPQRRNYQYVPLAAEDYRARIDAGMNLFCVSPEQEKWVRNEAVFYIRSAAGDTPVQYPADFYRSNYAGNEMFMDEPTCVMVGDKRIHTRLQYFTDAAAVLTGRIHTGYFGPNGAAYGIERELRARGISLGDMRLVNADFPTWETVYETACYQLAGGAAGIVHEGRYQLDAFNTNLKASTGLDRVFTAEEMFRYHYAFLRGAARQFGRDWGTSIYGQADPALSPAGINLAYDMGARYIWFWTSDHDHHMPWPEQIELTRSLRRHAMERPRPSIRGQRPLIDKLILIPYGYFLTLESPTGRKQPFDLWWVREMDAEGRNDSSRRYRRLMRNAHVEVIKALDARESFDIGVDDGHDVPLYKQAVRVKDE